jgi:predicted negative regulator of RcsB-dependent stress response
LDVLTPAGEMNFMSEHTTLDATTGAPLGEISHAPPALEAFLDKHQMKLIVLAILLVISAAVYVVMDGVKQSNEETAGALLNTADDLSGLQSVVKNHGDTAAAFSAKILLAEKQWDDGQQDDAIATLKAFVESDRDHPARPSAEASLAAKLWAQGKTDDAAKVFQDLADDTDSRYLAPYAWISLGDIEAAKGNADAAAKAYETVEEEFPSSTFSQEAMSRRLLLKAKDPIEVAAAIVVPDANIIGSDEGDTPAGDASVEDLLNSIKQGAGDAGANPLMPEPETPQPAE